MFRLICASASLAVLTACVPQSNLQDRISGKWEMAGVRIFNEDASPALNPMNNRWISFAPNGTFASGSGEKQENAGTYTLNDKIASLNLDSDAGPGDDSSWRLKFQNDTLLMRGIGTDRQTHSELVLVR